MMTFDPLWQTMRRKGITQYALIKDCHMSTGTLDALRKNRSVTLNTLNDLCELLDCNIGDIVRYIPNKHGKCE